MLHSGRAVAAIVKGTGSLYFKTHQVFSAKFSSKFQSLFPVFRYYHFSKGYFHHILSTWRKIQRLHCGCFACSILELRELLWKKVLPLKNVLLSKLCHCATSYKKKCTSC